MKAMAFGSLIRGITANINAYIGDKVEPFGVKQGQFEYFIQIYMNPGINQLELARRKNVGKASVTKALKILEDQGFVKREVDSEDRRNIKCFVTDTGSDIIDSFLKVQDDIEVHLFNNFSEEERAVFYASLEKLYQNTALLMNHN